MDSAGRHGEVEPALLDGRPDHHPAVRTRDDIHPGVATIRSDTGDAAAPRRFTTSPLTGRTGGRASSEPSRAPRPATRGENDPIGTQLAPVRDPHPAQPLAFDHRIDCVGAWDDPPPARPIAATRAPTSVRGSTSASSAACTPPRSQARARAPARGTQPGGATRRPARAIPAARDGGEGPRPRRRRARREERRYGDSRPASEASSSSAANSGYARAESRLSCSSASSPTTPRRPARASPPPPAMLRRRGYRDRSRAPTGRAARRAMRTPARSPPPPQRGLRWFSRRVARTPPLSLDGRLRTTIPAPALPGSGSDGRRRPSRLSARHPGSPLSTSNGTPSGITLSGDGPTRERSPPPARRGPSLLRVRGAPAWERPGAAARGGIRGRHGDARAAREVARGRLLVDRAFAALPGGGGAPPRAVHPQ